MPSEYIGAILFKMEEDDNEEGEGNTKENYLANLTSLKRVPKCLNNVTRTQYSISQL